MARIIEPAEGKRRMIKMSAEDVISVIREYQNIVPRNVDYESVRSYLEDRVIFIPEDI